MQQRLLPQAISLGGPISQGQHLRVSGGYCLPSRASASDSIDRLGLCMCLEERRMGDYYCKMSVSEESVCDAEVTEPSYRLSTT